MIRLALIDEFGGHVTTLVMSMHPYLVYCPHLLLRGADQVLAAVGWRAALV